MKLTEALLGEHGVFYAQFGHLERTLPATTTLAEVQAPAALLAAGLATHARLEDELLFTKLDPSGPVAVMRREHEQIEGDLSRAQEVSDLAQAQQLVLHAVQVARDHFIKEEEVLFPMAEQTLGEEALRELGTQWARERQVRLR
jgi:iron-sulfur cluster repair protein YtfE (RIC family)